MTAAARGRSAALRPQALVRLALAGACGAALNLAFAPVGWWPLAVLLPAGLFVLIRGLPPRRAAWAGAAFGVGLYGVGTHWLYTCLHVFGLVPVWLTLALQMALVAILSGYPAALCWLANRFWLKPGISREWLVLPGSWVLLEWLRGWIFTGFPWLSLGYAFIDAPLSGLAPLCGVYGVTWAAAAAASALAAASSDRYSTRQRVTATAASALIISLPLLTSGRDWSHASGAPIPIAAVQGAVPQDQKWQASNRDATIERYTTLTERAWGARLIVWPEAALPVLAPEIADYLDNLRKLGLAHGADFAIGLVDYRFDTRQYFNGVLVIGAAGGGWYYKHHLVPFGEYFPVPQVIRSWMRLLSLPYEDFSAGPQQQAPLTAAGQRLGISICYEDAFGSSQLDALRSATLLVNVTNNAWFGNSSAPHQHLQIARMRALEAGRYLIRATNDGITALLGPHGEIVARLPQFEEAVLRADALPLTGLTPYARVGNYPVVLGAGSLLALAAWRRRRGD